TLVPGGEVEVGLRPLLRPLVFVTVEAGGAEPVLMGEGSAVLDAHAALFRAVDKEQSTERPPGLSAEAGLRLLLDDDDALTRVHELCCCDQAGEARPDDDGGCCALMIGHCLLWHG